MIFYAFCAFSFAAFGLCVGEEFTLPTCKRNSADYSACLTRAIQESWPRFLAGIPELDFPPMDPIFFDNMKATFTRGEVHGVVVASNITGKGYKKARFLNVRPHFSDDAFRLEVDLQMPKFDVECECDAQGNVGAFRMGGQGHFNATAEDIRLTWDITGHIVNDVWTIEHFIASPLIGNLKVSFNGLFGDNKEINDLAAYFINEYWPSLYRMTLPDLSKTWEPGLMALSNIFFSKLSFSKIFPEN